MGIRNPPSSDDVRAVAQGLEHIANAITANGIVANRQPMTEGETQGPLAASLGTDELRARFANASAWRSSPPPRRERTPGRATNELRGRISEAIRADRMNPGDDISLEQRVFEAVMSYLNGVDVRVTFDNSLVPLATPAVQEALRLLDRDGRPYGITVEGHYDGRQR